MKVLSFNIRSGDDPGGHSIDERAPRLKKIIEKYDPDIIGFQEVVPKWYPHVVEDYGETYEILHKYRNEKTDIEGCSILWKKGMFELLDHGCFWYSETSAVSSIGSWSHEKHYRFCLWAKLKEIATGKEFHFFDTHFGGGNENQVRSAEILRAYVKAMEAEEMILVGDFNLRDHNDGYKVLTEFLVDLNMATAKDRRITGHDYDLSREGTPIDFCFISPHTVEPISYHRIDDTVEGKFPSDHCGLLLELNIKDRLRITSVDLRAEGLAEGEREALSRRARNRIARLCSDVAIVHHCDEMMQSKMEHLHRYDQKGELFWDQNRFALVESLSQGVVLKNLISGEELTILAEGDQVIYKGEKLIPYACEKKELNPAEKEGTYSKYAF